MVVNEDIPDRVRAEVLREAADELIATNRALTIEGAIAYLRDWADQLDAER